jgi:hypothetical protein
MPEVIPYRSPRAAADERTARIVRRLRMRELGGFARIVAGYALGVPLCFLAPAMITLLLTGSGGRYGPVLPPIVSPGACFVVLSILMVPLLIWYERRTRGEYFMDALREWGGDDGPWFGGSIHRGVDTEGPGAILLMELFLFGPRLVIGATRSLRERSRVRHVPLALAADVLLHLLRHDGGIPPAELRDVSTEATAVRDAILYLAFFDWVDLSKDRTRIWVLTDARKALGEPAHA